MRRIGLVLGLILLLGIGGVFLLGLRSWPVTGPLQKVFQKVEAKTQWHLSVAHARWTPWRNLELTDLKIVTAQGGRLHVVKARIVPRLKSLFRGHLVLQWYLDEVRMDPGSWGITVPMAQEVLSAGPVVNSGSGILRVEPERVTFQTLTLDGPMLRLQAEGWLVVSQRQTYWVMQGALPRKLLEAMSLMKSGNQAVGSWEPFQVRLHGALGHPEISFVSSFFSASVNTRGDHR